MEVPDPEALQSLPDHRETLPRPPGGLWNKGDSDSTSCQGTTLCLDTPMSFRTQKSGRTIDNPPENRLNYGVGSGRADGSLGGGTMINFL